MVALSRQRRSRLASWSLRTAFLSIPVLAAAGLAHRFDVIPTTYMLIALAVGYCLAFAALIVAIAALGSIWREGSMGFGKALLGLFVSAVVLSLPLASAWLIVTLPRLADISTDLAHPPQFSMIRIDRPSSEGAEAGPASRAAALQREAYPDVATRSFRAGTGAVFGAARAIVEQRGWQVLDLRQPVEAGEAARIEAVASSFLFAFRDGLVIRIEREPEGSRIDMRSASFIGAHDMGSNARRIEAFFAELEVAVAKAGS